MEPRPGAAAARDAFDASSMHRAFTENKRYRKEPALPADVVNPGAAFVYQTDAI